MDGKIDETIESICDVVQGRMKNLVSACDIPECAGMVSALAELIKANAEYKIVAFQVNSIPENYLSSESSNDRMEL